MDGQATASANRQVIDTKPKNVGASNGAQADGANGQLIYLNGSAGDAAMPAAASTDTDPMKTKIGELTQQEKKQLRMARFGSASGNNKVPGIPEAATTFEAM